MYKLFFLYCLISYSKIQILYFHVFFDFYQKMYGLILIKAQINVFQAKTAFAPIDYRYAKIEPAGTFP